MNHLAHFFLAGEDPGLLVGGFLGDYVKGRLKGERGASIEAGIVLHRAIDAYTDQHPVTRKSQARFEPRFRRFSGIMTDIIYDHFLAANWHAYHSTDLQGFSDKTFETLLAHREHLPTPAFQTCERMQATNSLFSYQNPEFVDRSFHYLCRRLRRANPLDQGYDEFLQHKCGLYEDFVQFFPELVSFCRGRISELQRQQLVIK